MALIFLPDNRRYYPSDVLFPDPHDQQTRKLARSVSGKTYRPDTLMRAVQWQANRRVMLRASRKLATKDMESYFKQREERERMAELRDQLDREARKARKGEYNLSEEEEAPMVATSRSVPLTSKTKASQERTFPKQTTVTSGNEDDSDTIVVATMKA